MSDSLQKLSMAGKIRTKEACPNCGGKFIGTPLSCPKCKTHPKHFYIDMYVRGSGQVKLYSDKMGRPLNSYAYAQDVLVGIRYEQNQRTFDPTKYIKKDARNYLFENRIEAWYQSKVKEVEKGNLAQSYIVKLKCYKDTYYLPYFKTRDVREIRTFGIYNFYENIPLQNHKDEKKQISLKYIKNIMNALENFFNTLLRLEYIKERPNFPVVTVDRKAPKWLDRKTQLEILKAIPEELRPIFTFLCFQGVRPGEARALRVKDIDFDNEAVTISRTFSGGLPEVKDRVKGKHVKPRALNPVLIPLLLEACKGKHPETYVFTQKNGRHYSETFLRGIWETARDVLGLDINLYQATRHSFASNAVSDEIPINIIKEVMGHTDIKTTMIYAHASLSSQRVFFKKHGEVVDLKTLQPRHSPGDTGTDKK